MQTPHASARFPVYPSAVDLWVAALLFMSPLFAAALALYLWMDGNSGGATILMITAIATLLLTLILVFPCRYTIEDADLHVRCGILSYRIPLKTIERVEASRTLASGPALSMRRVKVYTRMKNYVLSPRDRESFISELSAAAAKHRSDQGAE